MGLYRATADAERERQHLPGAHKRCGDALLAVHVDSPASVRGYQGALGAACSVAVGVVVVGGGRGVKKTLSVNVYEKHFVRICFVNICPQ